MADVVKSPRWDLEISSFVGTLSYAEHYMGRIKRSLYQAVDGEPDAAYSAYEIVTLDYVLDEDAAKRLSTDDYTWDAGDTSTRFFSRDSVVESAIRAMDQFAVEGEWLEDYDFVKDEDIALWGEIGDDNCGFTRTRTGYGNPLKDINHYLSDKEMV